jgi:hypothetical protein
MEVLGAMTLLGVVGVSVRGHAGGLLLGESGGFSGRWMKMRGG